MDQSELFRTEPWLELGDSLFYPDYYFSIRRAYPTHWILYQWCPSNSNVFYNRIQFNIYYLVKRRSFKQQHRSLKTRSL